MFIFRRCRSVLALALLGCAAAWASPPLTIIQDILYSADGTRFEGQATITWSSFVASDQSNVPAGVLTVRIESGLLRVQLAPTTNAFSPASYNVVYNSEGRTQFTETWAVPSSNVPVRVNAIRVGPAGTIIGGGGGGGGVGGLTTVNISDVNGLVSALALRATIGSGYTPTRAAVIDATGSLDGAVGNPGDCLHVDGTSGACGSGAGVSSASFVDGEVPVGSLTGVNSAFQLGNPPSPTASLQLYRNGMLQKQGSDYNLSGTQIIFVAGAVPQPSDVLVASYRVGIAPSGFVFVDSEAPSGTIDGSNTSYTLSQAPNPVASLALYRNGLRLRANLDFTVSGTAVVFLPGLAPQPGDTLICSYRH